MAPAPILSASPPSLNGVKMASRTSNGLMTPNGLEAGNPTWKHKDGKINKVCCIGAGYVGGPTCAVMANRIPSVKVTVVDLDSSRIDAWNSNSLPFYEPDLEPIVRLARDGAPGDRRANLFFTTGIEEAIREADIIFISVNTPIKRYGLGAGRASDLAFVESASRMIAEESTTDKIIVEKSTVPCRTADNIRAILDASKRPGVHFDILSNPEFLAEGTAIRDLLSPDRVLSTLR